MLFSYDSVLINYANVSISGDPALNKENRVMRDETLGKEQAASRAGMSTACFFWMLFMLN